MPLKGTSCISITTCGAPGRVGGAADDEDDSSEWEEASGLGDEDDDNDGALTGRGDGLGPDLVAMAAAAAEAKDDASDVAKARTRPKTLSICTLKPEKPKIL